MTGSGHIKIDVLLEHGISIYGNELAFFAPSRQDDALEFGLPI
jgi:hypothetical protein